MTVNYAERKAKRLADMSSTKVLFASNWFLPADITLDDCVSWQHARKTKLSSSGRFEIFLRSHLLNYLPISIRFSWAASRKDISEAYDFPSWQGREGSE